MHRRSFLVQGGLILAVLAGCGDGGRGGSTTASGRDVIEVARANGLERFVQAIAAAGLAETLAGTGPFTLFAPSDRAFAALPRGRMTELQRPANRAELQQLVAYHVVPGMLTTSFLEGRDVNHTTATGTSLNVDGTAGIRVNDANVATTDLFAANGVVHVIDRVLTPR